MNLYIDMMKILQFLSNGVEQFACPSQKTQHDITSIKCKYLNRRKIYNMEIAMFEVI
jgi:hypothetical protein